MTERYGLGDYRGVILAVGHLLLRTWNLPRRFADKDLSVSAGHWARRRAGYLGVGLPQSIT